MGPKSKYLAIFSLFYTSFECPLCMLLPGYFQRTFLRSGAHGEFVFLFSSLNESS